MVCSSIFEERDGAAGEGFDVVAGDGFEDAADDGFVAGVVFEDVAGEGGEDVLRAWLFTRCFKLSNCWFNSSSFLSTFRILSLTIS